MSDKNEHVGTAKKLSEVGTRTPLKSATISEVKEVLYKADELGLVHQLITAPTKVYSYVICNCCPCCCVMINSVNRLKNSNIVSKSHFIPTHDTQTGIHCGVCVDRCYFEALSVDSGEPVYYADNCVGCGICVSTCPSNSIKLIPRTK